MAGGIRRTGDAPAEATAFDWLLLAIITLIGGLSFSMIHTAVETMPPPTVAVGRLWIGAIFLYAIMRLKGRRFPRLVVRTEKGLRPHRVWASMIAAGVTGYSVPFLLFPYAQQHVESGLAGIYMAFMPIWTLLLAYIFAGENLNWRKGAGFALGFVGVAILMGPEIIGGAARSSVVAQASLLVATLGYAASVIISRRAPPVRPRVYAAGTVLAGAMLATPAIFLAPVDPSSWKLSGVLSVVGLGLLPTGLNGLLIIMLVRRAGAGFMALANYMTPVWAVMIGAAIFNERLASSAFVALAVILAGVAVSQWRMKRKPTIAGAGGQIAEVADKAAFQK